MPGDADNPYAPPVADTAEPEEIAGTWSVQGDFLVVREGAVLPPVDLDGRGAGGPLTPLLLRMGVPVGGKVVLLMLVPAVLMLGYLAFERGVRERSGFPGILVVLLLSHFLSRGVKIRGTPAFVWGQVSVPALRAMTGRTLGRGRVTSALTLFLLILAAMVFADIGRDPGGVAIAMAFTLVGYLAVLFWAAMDSGWRCTRARDGWLWIKGVGPFALGELARRAGDPLPPPVRRKVFKLRLNRLPWSHWRRINGGRPGAWWQTLMLRVGRPEVREQLVYHWSERQWLPPEQGDPELIDAWSRETVGTPLAEWRLVHAERIDSPTRCIRVEEIVFLSPDGRHAAMSVVYRVAVGRSLRETREVAFRSWTVDGRILATGNMPPAAPLPDGFEMEYRKGSPRELARRHLERAAAASLVAVDAAGLRQREEEEMRGRHEALEAAGLCGPVEEVEEAGSWE
jgi:hypothetical protein